MRDVVFEHDRREVIGTGHGARLTAMSCSELPLIAPGHLLGGALLPIRHHDPNAGPRRLHRSVLSHAAVL
jgi:hypothetical protein